MKNEIDERTKTIEKVESTINVMLELINVLTRCNSDHFQDLNLINDDFQRKNRDFTEFSRFMENNFDIRQEIEQIRFLEKEKLRLNKELLDDTLLLDRLKTVLGKSISQ